MRPRWSGALALARACCVALALGCWAERVGAPEAVPVFSIVSGDVQTGRVGEELPKPLVVRATDAAGRPRPGVTVVYVVTQGGGSLYAAGVLTNSAGFAQNFWSLGAVPGLPQAVEVRSVDPMTGQKQLHGTFTAIATP